MRHLNSRNQTTFVVVLCRFCQRTRLRLPKDPSEVRRDRHDNTPSSLPSPTANYEEVRYFLYSVLTTRMFRCVEKCPQWILETCWSWDRNGDALLCMDDPQLMLLCPTTSVMAGQILVDRLNHKIENMPPPHAREMIEKAMIAVMNDPKLQEGKEAWKRWQQLDWETGTSPRGLRPNPAASLSTSYTFPQLSRYPRVPMRYPSARNPAPISKATGWLSADETRLEIIHPNARNNQPVDRQANAPLLGRKTSQRLTGHNYNLQAVPAF